MSKRPTRARFAHQARRLRKSKCERCGSDQDLHAHHRNRDWTDNREENIETLCMKCHDDEHKRGGRYPRRPEPPPMTEEELEEAGRYYVKRLLVYTRKWLEVTRACTAIEQVRTRSPESNAWKATTRKYNIGHRDYQRFQRAWRAALVEALAE